MEIKCPSCGLLNPESAVSCAECGAALTTPYAAPVVAPSDTVVVHRSGTNQSAVLATVALALVALVVVGFLMYQWGRSEQTDEDLAAARTDRAAEPRRTTPAEPPTVVTTPATAPPVVTTYPTTPTTVTVPVPVPQGAPAPSPSATSAAQNAKYVAQVEPLLREWESLVTAAKTQTGPSLSQTITRLEAVERRANAISAPASAASAQGHLLTAMTSTIDALKSSAEVVEDPSSSAALQRAEELYSDFQTEFESLRSGR
jgi:hypothetical protein